jgi:hypothetical protein
MIPKDQFADGRLPVEIVEPEVTKQKEGEEEFIYCLEVPDDKVFGSALKNNYHIKAKGRKYCRVRRILS